MFQHSAVELTREVGELLSETVTAAAVDLKPHMLSPRRELGLSAPDWLARQLATRQNRHTCLI